MGHQNAITDQNQAVVAVPFYLLLAGAMQLRANHGYPSLWGGSLPAVPFSATSQARAGSRRSSPATRRPQTDAAPRPKLDRLDRLFWIVLRRLWEGWCEALIILKAETVVSWHRAGFRRFWRWRSQRRRPGRPQANAEIRQLIRRMKADNPTWGAPRIHGEPLRLGFDNSEPTVSRYLHNLNGCRD